MFHWMHAQTTERLDVGVSMMNGVDVLVQNLVVNKTMSKVEMNFTPQWN